MEEELNENELEERFYSMLHYVDETQANVTTDKNALNIFDVAPRSTVRRYWRTSGERTTPMPVNTPYQKVNIPTEAPKKPATTEPKPKEEKCASPVVPLPQLPSLFQSPVPQNMKKTIEIIETEENVVELESSDEDEVVEVALPPKPTYTIESSEDEITVQDSPTKAKPVQDKSSNSGEREVSASPVPSIVSSVSDDFIRGDCIALNISSRRPDNHSFDFSLHGPDLLGSTPSKKKKKKKNKSNGTSTPVQMNFSPIKSTVFDECFATPKSKAKNKKQKTKSYAVTEKSIPSIDIYDSDSNQSIMDTNKKSNSYVVTEKSLPCADVYETDSNPSEAVKVVKNSKPGIDIEGSDSSASLDKTFKITSGTPLKDVTSEVTETIDLTDNSTLNESVEIQENIMIGNVSGFIEPDFDNEPVTDITQDEPKFGSTKVPAILYANLDFDNLKGKEKVCKSRRYSLTTLRAEMEKFYNESWGGEDFNHREIQKNMSRDKNLWAIDPKDRMPSLSRKKYNVTCNYCNRPGHRDDMCRQKPPVCYMCGNTGHVEPRCPTKICVNCGSPNYMYSTMCRNCSSWGRITCAECGQNGHPSSHCPDTWRRYHNTIDATAHLEQNRLTKKHFQLFCSGCTRRGHLVHACRHSLPFSGLPINSPYVNMYRPIYAPLHYTNSPNTFNQSNRQSFPNYPQDVDITSATNPVRNDRQKRQSKSPTVHETHTNKKRNLSMSDVPERQSTKSPLHQEPHRKISQNTEPAEDMAQVAKIDTNTSNVSEGPEKALDFIPIFSNNRDKRGQVIQDNEVSDTSDVVTSARIYVTSELMDKLKTNTGEEWFKEIADKLQITVEKMDTNSFLSIKGKVADQEAFQAALKDWVKANENTVQAKKDDATNDSDESENLMIQNIPKNRFNVLRKLSKSLESLKEDLGEPNALYKELNYFRDLHEKLLKQKVLSPKQLDNSRDHINEMLKKLNMVLLGQAGLADGSEHVQRLYTLQTKLINTRQKKISYKLRKEIGEHYHCIFTPIPRNDYSDLLKSFNCIQPQNRYDKKEKLQNSNSKMKKLNSIPISNQQKNRNPLKELKRGVEVSKSKMDENPLRTPPVDKTINKLVFYRRRLMNARPNDKVLKSTRAILVRKLHSHITSLSKNTNTKSKRMKKIKKIQEQAQLFLNNV